MQASQHKQSLITDLARSREPEMEIEKEKEKRWTWRWRKRFQEYEDLSQYDSETEGCKRRQPGKAVPDCQHTYISDEGC